MVEVSASFMWTVTIHVQWEAIFWSYICSVHGNLNRGTEPRATNGWEDGQNCRVHAGVDRSVEANLIAAREE